jgi:hypothetical protein
MVEIKGIAVNDAIKAIKVSHGDQAYNKIIGLLKGESRKLFENATILSSEWYPLDAFVQFLEMDIKVTLQGDEKELIRRSEALVERQLTGVYKVFVRWGSPEFVLNRISIVHRSYYRGVDIEISLPSAGKAIVKHTGFAKQHRLMGLANIGFYRKALEISGAKDVSAEYATSIEDDKGYCELVLSWHGKK